MLELEIGYLAFLLLMLIQGALNLFLSLFIWEQHDRINLSASPSRFVTPVHTFSIIVPAKNEEAVIAETIRQISMSNYPADKYEILFVCDSSDKDTAEAAKRCIQKHTIKNAKIIAYNDGPISKPHGLNVALSLAKYNKVVIFDAEDSVHPDILNIANTLYETTNADIIQAGVQLMDYRSRWYSSHNVLEYYFWFKSRMHFQAKIGVVPLGGNTVFFKTKQLISAGGWSETCLTEDAEIGIRLSNAGSKIIATYDPRHVTKEETPATINQFIKQRTRWNQGFIQILKSGEWMMYDKIYKRVFCFYTLSFPFVQAIALVVMPFTTLIGLTTKMPIVVSMFSFFPIFLILIQISVNCVGLYEFTKEHNSKAKVKTYVLMIITFFPYQILLSISALRAVYRELKGKNNWEKTAHTGLHRNSSISSLAGAPK